MEGPPPEAYSRYSDPLKYVPVAEALDPLVANLVATYDATVEPLPVAPEDDRVVRALRVVPRSGAPLVFEVTMLPSILARRGWWNATGVPHCGCDACDEDPAACIEELRGWVDEAVAGEFTEELTEDGLTVYTRDGWQRSGMDPEWFATLSAVAPPGTHRWPPWPRRTG